MHHSELLLTEDWGVTGQGYNTGVVYYVLDDDYKLPAEIENLTRRFAELETYLEAEYSDAAITVESSHKE